ncbi:MAG: bifunctional folylpolyglutamate synthase/dihydrofolate synthase [Planctomycetes bacterium]|nr:bifunctional folylpolyglutamate synthase/dihydrofolate synthase [Planctomycetota bacterium]
MKPRPTSPVTPLEFLYGRINYERTSMPSGGQGLKLDRMRDLLRALGNPHFALPSVHVAGTKGKGSTAVMFSSVAAAAGIRTGLYTSPHLHAIEERIAIDGRPIPTAEFLALLAQVRDAVHVLDRHWVEAQGAGPTFFEILTAVAFLYFQRASVQLAVMEVGLGGRLDSTNVCLPVLSIITSISLDHVRQLGDTVEAIAAEKAGIIKPGVPVVSGVVQDGPAGVIAAIANRESSRIYKLGLDFDFEMVASPASEARLAIAAFNYREPAESQRANSLRTRIDGLRIPARGMHQRANAALVCCGVERLRQAGWQIPDSALREGLANSQFPARTQIVRDRPLIILDVAHNRASVEALLEAIPPANYRSKTLLFAASQDKDVDGMIEVIIPFFDRVVLTRFLENPRAVAPRLLAEYCQNFMERHPGVAPEIQVAETPADAWSECRRSLGPDDLLCISGSFFLAAELSRIVQMGWESALPS